mmetsp:Transcript_21578/g.60063  ORF Transcript_21578/g.60063 Transcript_21578/m.60063 type:complete len:213 (+) Transcript_21578:109-747(+)
MVCALPSQLWILYMIPRQDAASNCMYNGSHPLSFHSIPFQDPLSRKSMEHGMRNLSRTCECNGFVRSTFARRRYVRNARTNGMDRHPDSNDSTTTTNSNLWHDFPTSSFSPMLVGQSVCRLLCTNMLRADHSDRQRPKSLQQTMVHVHVVVENPHHDAPFDASSSAAPTEAYLDSSIALSMASASVCDGSPSPAGSSGPSEMWTALMVPFTA